MGLTQLVQRSQPDAAGNPFINADQCDYVDANNITWTVFYTRTRGSDFRIVGFQLGAHVIGFADVTATFQQSCEEAVEQDIFDRDHNPDFFKDFS